MVPLTPEEYLAVGKEARDEPHWAVPAPRVYQGKGCLTCHGEERIEVREKGMWRGRLSHCQSKASFGGKRFNITVPQGRNKQNATRCLLCIWGLKEGGADPKLLV